MSEYIEQLKSDPSVNRIKDIEGNEYGIRVLGRGENLFFQENDKALICQINAGYGIIFIKSIKNWEGEKKMSESEKNRVVNLIKKYYREIYNPDVKMSHERP